MSDEFVSLLRRGLAQVGSQKELARVLGLSQQRISNALAGKGYPFGVLNCLRLARLIAVRDWTVLRAAGKPEVADLLEQAYGDRRIRVSPHHDPFAGLTAAQRARLTAIARDLRTRTK